LILPQVFLGLAGIVGGAYYFVEVIEDIADKLHFNPLILSLIIAPIATELPEKINSVLWVRNSKDTLALGNVTGALVFQSCIPVAFGVAFTPWDLTAGTVLTGVTAIFSASVVLTLLVTQKLKFIHLAFGAALYAIAVSGLLYLEGGSAGAAGAHGH
jgi:cation:H+ antiporter